MDRLQAMKVFTRVVEAGSFTRAADTLDLPRASVTIIIQQLEAHLKVRLLQRTTRRLSLTTDGSAYYESCVRIIGEIDEVESTFTGIAKTPRGKLRIEMPAALGRVLIVPYISQFCARYPEVNLMLGFGDKPVDLVQEGVDCAIRVGALPDSTMVARRVATYHAMTVASPQYLAEHGTPTSLEDLENHVAVNYFWARTGRIMDLTFEADGDLVQIRMQGKIAVNDADAYVNSGLEGLGLIQSARFLALPHIKTGRLVEVLSTWKPSPMPISVIYPHSRHLAPVVRAFVDWVAELFSNSELLAEDGEASGREVDQFGNVTAGNGVSSGPIRPID